MIYAVNPYPYAIKLEDCIINEVRLSGQDYKKFFSEAEYTEEFTDAFFGKQNRIENEYDFCYSYRYEDYHVNVADDFVSVKWNKNVDEDFNYEEQYCNDSNQVKEKINPFTMGLHSYNFTDMSKVSDMSIYYLNESNYVSKFNFTYNLNDNIYYVAMYQSSEVEAFMNLSKQHGVALYDYQYVDQYQYLHIPKGYNSYGNDFYCRYDGNAIMHIIVEKADGNEITESDFEVFLHDISANLIATPIK